MSELTLASVLRKTEAGIVAFKSHDRNLTLQTRSLLIMVDGTKSLQDLARFSPSPDAVLVAATYLLDNQLVTISALAVQAVSKPAVPGNALSSAAAPTPAPAASLSPKPAEPAGDLKTSIRKASRALEDLLGPSSEPLCLKIEKCKSMDEFATVVQSIRPVVASMRSESKAVEFVNRALG